MKATKDSANLDVLRAIAVMCVFCDHLLHFSSGVATEFQWHLGQVGVLMFFVHTSLVLMFSLERTRLAGWPLFASFYTRRIFRIYPLSIFCVLAVYFSRYSPGLQLVRETWTYRELVANVTLTQNLFYARDFLGVLWSLPLEVQMYFFLPFLFIKFRSRSVRPVVILWLLSIPFALLQSRYAGRLNVFSYAPCFLAGIISWRLHAPKRDSLPGWLWPICIAAISLIWFAADRQHNMYFRWVFCLILGFAIPFFAEIPSTIIKTVAKTIAKYSYGVYLSHQFAMTIGFVLLRNHFAQWSTFLVLAALVPFLMYHLIEHPGILAGQKIAKQLWTSQPRKSLVAIPEV
jgi:peptidoglycan/LPS O-acetylase OafA/YrhL